MCITKGKLEIIVNGMAIECNCTAFLNDQCTNEGYCINQTNEKECLSCGTGIPDSNMNNICEQCEENEVETDFCDECQENYPIEQTRIVNEEKGEQCLCDECFEKTSTSQEEIEQDLLRELEWSNHQEEEKIRVFYDHFECSDEEVNKITIKGQKVSQEKIKYEDIPGTKEYALKRIEEIEKTFGK
jgi:hypothetical protein